VSDSSDTRRDVDAALSWQRLFGRAPLLPEAEYVEVSGGSCEIDAKSASAPHLVAVPESASAPTPLASSRKIPSGVYPEREGAPPDDHGGLRHSRRPLPSSRPVHAPFQVSQQRIELARRYAMESRAMTTRANRGPSS
jgi:hypothetical protein